jgi:hypothetical protein
MYHVLTVVWQGQWVDDSAISAPIDKGKRRMDTLKVHWNIFPGIIETNWHDTSNRAVWSNFPVCNQARYRKNDTHVMPVLATEHVSELTCEKCIAAVVGNGDWLSWQLDREENAQRDAGIALEQRTTRVTLWNARMYTLPYRALAVFSFLPVGHPARTTDKQAVGYAMGWAYIITQKQPA